MMYKFPLSRERSRHGKLKIYVKEFATKPDGSRYLRQDLCPPPVPISRAIRLGKFRSSCLPRLHQ
jgi:hypothetical protein